jgi:hypothetical protein
MLSGWTTGAALDARARGTEFVTIGVPDDFYAVRVGLPNVNPVAWTVSKIVACASAKWNDYLNPVDNKGAARPPRAWSALTFRHAGMENSSLVTNADSATEIAVAANATDPASGETSNPAWTFTDWVPCASIGSDPATGMRVLMLRALVPGAQTVCFTNGAMDYFNGKPDVNRGYDHFVGGLKEDHDMVTEPGTVSLPIEALRTNRLVNGQMMSLIQVLTRNAGIVGMVTGDSHHAGSGTRGEINNLLVQCLLPLGRETVGTIPVGVVSTAVGGAVSRQFFPRLIALLRAVRPTFVVLPGWSANEADGPNYATQTAEDIMLARLLLAADAVRDAGALPIFLTPFPRDPGFMTPPVLTTWLAQREAILAMRTSGEIVIDAASVLGLAIDGQFTGTYREGLSGDAVHPNEMGHAALAAALTPIVRGIAGLPQDVEAPPPVTEPPSPAPPSRPEARRSGGVFAQTLLPWKRGNDS